MATPSSRDDTWTTVGRGKGGRPSHAKSPNVNGPDSSITAEHLRKDFDKKLKLWKGSTCRRSLLQMLEKNKPDEGWSFTNAVCLATGSFSTQNFELNKRSMLQLASFIDLASIMEEEAESKIESFAQEPSYSEADQEFLSSLGITVLPLPAGVKPFDIGLGPSKTHMGFSTLVCNFFMNISLTAVEDFFRIKHGLYIGTQLNQSYGVPAPEFELAKRTFHEEYAMRKMPRFEEDPGVFEGLMVYWPEPREDVDAEGYFRQA